MDPRRQAALVERLERLAATRPRAYRVRVLALALLGYGVVHGVPLAVLGLLGLVTWGVAASRTGSAVAMLAIPLGALAWLLARALSVRLEPPGGRALTREGAPALFALVDRVRRRLAAPAADVVLVTPELDASVTQVPRLGIAGWPRRYLSIGLPLLAALTRVQLEAVLAHELAHLSHKQARFGHWAYRLARTWDRLLESLQQRRGWGARLFERFFTWYAPHFEACTSVLSRLAVLEADRVAGESTTPRAAAEGLVTLALAARFMDDAYWPAVYRGAHHDATPPRTAYSDLMRALRAVRTVEESGRWLEDALATTTPAGSSRPALRDRLASLGVPASAFVAGGEAGGTISEAQSAAAALLGERMTSLVGELDARWREDIAAPWRAQHRLLQDARARRALLTERARAGVLAPDEAWTLARETLELDGEEPALPLLRDVVARAPRHAAASFTLGRLLLSRGDEGGLALLARPAELDPQATLAACELAEGFLLRLGRREEALAWQQRAHQHRQLLERAMREREGIAVGDEVAPITLDDADREAARVALAASPEVRRAWVARKVTRLLPERPFVVLAVERDAAWWKYRGPADDRRLLGALLERVSLSLEGDLWIVVLDGKSKWLRRTLERSGAEVVYERAAGDLRTSDGDRKPETLGRPRDA